MIGAAHAHSTIINYIRFDNSKGKFVVGFLLGRFSVFVIFHVFSFELFSIRHGSTENAQCGARQIGSLDDDQFSFSIHLVQNGVVSSL